MIEINGPALSQWDVGRSVKITGIDAEYAHFANKGDSKAVVVGVVDIDAKIPDFLLQTGKELCVYAVKDGITIESKTFYVKKREQPENYVYEDDKRNYIYELITDAERAIEDAIIAAEDASTSAGMAKSSAENAVKIADSANKAADSAIQAAKNANEAAVKAANTAKSLMVVGKVEGASIQLDDAIEQYFVGLRIYGKTTQDGTPTPDAPVELVSVGDSGSIAVNVTGENDAQSMTVTTPNGLPGIPVTEGGNYTDANGQQWVCDEIDFARGVYVQRVRRVVYDGSSDETWANNGTEDNRCFTVWTNDAAVGINLSFCDKFMNVVSAWHSAYAVSYGIYADHQTITAKYFRPPNESATTLDKWREWLAKNPITLVYALATPIETPLPEEELAAYAALHTYKDHTTVSNDAGAWMELEYMMDAKKYIDRKFAQTNTVATIGYVDLLAANWVGDNAPYSQVVKIDGVTVNSQVDLTPSVEQLSVFYNKSIAFVTENENGVVTVYAIGEKPQNDYTIQVTITEVNV